MILNFLKCNKKPLYSGVFIAFIVHMLLLSNKCRSAYLAAKICRYYKCGGALPEKVEVKEVT